MKRGPKSARNWNQARRRLRAYHRIVKADACDAGQGGADYFRRIRREREIKRIEEKLQDPREFR
jgi:hypothetical protein